MKVSAVTGNVNGETYTANTIPLNTKTTKYAGLANLPNENLVLLNPFGVRVNLNNPIKPYAAMVGIPAALTRDVKATLEGRMTQRMAAPKMYMTVTALRGRPSGVTWPIQEERGRTPSRAMAKIRREAATTAILVFYGIGLVKFCGWDWVRRTRMRPTTARMVMKVAPPLPRAME